MKKLKRLHVRGIGDHKSSCLCGGCGNPINLYMIDSANYWQSLPNCCQQHVNGSQENRQRLYREAVGCRGTRLG